MKVYIGAPYPMIEYAKRVRTLLVRQGMQVTSRWLDGDAGEQSAWAQHDLDDVRAADVLLALNPEGWENAGTGGRHVELGYAIALGKKVVLVGERTNVFHHLKQIKVIDDTEDIGKQVKKHANATL